MLFDGSVVRKYHTKSKSECNFVSISLSALFSEKVRNMSPDEIRIPPEPPGRCPSHLQVLTHTQLFNHIFDVHCKDSILTLTLQFGTTLIG